MTGTHELEHKGVIVYVDDERRQRENYAQLLRSRGFVVHTCDDVVKAIELVRDHDAEVVLLDLVFEGQEQGGDAVLTQLRGIKPWIGCVVLTGYDEQRWHERLLETRLLVDQWFSKPPVIDEVAQALKRSCASARVRGRLVDPAKTSGGFVVGSPDFAKAFEDIQLAVGMPEADWPGRLTQPAGATELEMSRPENIASRTEIDLGTSRHVSIGEAVTLPEEAAQPWTGHHAQLYQRRENSWNTRVTHPDEKAVFEALSDPRWVWYSLRAISEPVQLREQYVREVLYRYPALVRKWPATDREGQELFTLRVNPVGPLEWFALFRSYFTKGLY